MEYRNNITGIPILYIMYRRPFYVHRVLETIKKSRPGKLYIWSVGVGGGEDLFDVQQSRLIMHTLAEEISKNGGKVEIIEHAKRIPCDESVSSAIDWIMSKESEALIIEEDVDFNFDFLKFVENNKYQVEQNNYACISRRFNEGYETIFTFCPWGWYTTSKKWNQIFRKMPNSEITKYILKKYYKGIKTDAIKTINSSFKMEGFTWDDCYSYCMDIENTQPFFMPEGLTVHLDGNRSMSTNNLMSTI